MDKGLEVKRAVVVMVDVAAKEFFCEPKNLVLNPAGHFQTWK